ncbi:glutamine synthetase family protein [Galactobacter sp.]|uniref:glutamine synthetase family protein n=1 Tax=Galactobacter sp. TaxID=2676125 RepID=UPI0025BE3D02|nr:glutamine synthetase family protein [Galactobacter sp.]
MTQPASTGAQTGINREDELIFVATSDAAGITRGRAMRSADFSDRTSLGWVPADLGIGPLGHIVDDIPYGSSGDLRLRPDLDSRTRIPAVGERPSFELVFADLVETDGSDWESCSRLWLKRAVEELREDFGLVCTAAFEHEFVEKTATVHPHPFSLREFRAAEPIGSEVMRVLSEAGCEPENWLPEYAEHQFEVTNRPADPLAAADRAILVRDLVADVYAAHQREVTFSPVPVAGAGGSGVHVHYGLYGTDGSNVSFDAARPGRVSEMAARFNAGIVKYGPEMTALFAPLTISYQRLAPHNWSTARAFCGVRNREALVRVPPTNELDGRDPAPQLHFEFRGSDIGANPWLLMGLLLKAGMQGLKENLPPVDVVEGELELEGVHADLASLPSSLEEALEALSNGSVVRSWLASNWVEVFLQLKREEIRQLSHRSAEEQCEVYARAY